MKNAKPSSQADSKALTDCGTASAVPFVERVFPSRPKCRPLCAKTLGAQCYRNCAGNQSTSRSHLEDRVIKVRPARISFNTSELFAGLPTAWALRQIPGSSPGFSRHVAGQRRATAEYSRLVGVFLNRHARKGHCIRERATGVGQGLAFAVAGRGPPPCVGARESDRGRANQILAVSLGRDLNARLSSASSGRAFFSSERASP